jgi:hypothetical protein
MRPETSIFTVAETLELKFAIEKYHTDLEVLEKIQPRTKHITEKITLKTAKRQALLEIQNFSAKSLEELREHLETYAPDSDAVKGTVTSKTRRLIEHFRLRCHDAGLLSLDALRIDKLLKGYDQFMTPTIACNAETSDLLTLLRQPNHPLAEKNKAIDVYLANPQNCHEDLYGLLRLVKKPAPTKNRLLEEVWETNPRRWLYRYWLTWWNLGLIIRPDPSVKLTLEQLAKTCEAGNKPLIANLSAWQLCHLYNRNTQSSLLTLIRAQYEREKGKKHKNSASQDLSDVLASNKDVATQWQALLGYCRDPENKSRRLFTIIEAYFKKDVSLICCNAYHQACDWILTPSAEAQATERYTQAIILLSAIPTRDTRSDSPLGRSAIFAAMSEAEQRLENYVLAHQLVAMAQAHEPKKKKEAWGKWGREAYRSRFPEELPSRKARLYGLMLAHTESHHHFGVNADTKARRGLYLFGRSAKKTTANLGIVALGGVEKVFWGAVPFFPPASGIAIGVSVVSWGIIAAGGVHGAFHALSRKPCDEVELKNLGKQLKYVTHHTNEEEKREFIGSVCVAYQTAKTKASSHSSSKLLPLLLSDESLVAEKWNHLCAYLGDNINNGKLFFVIMRAQLAAKYTEAHPPPVAQPNAPTPGLL